MSGVVEVRATIAEAQDRLALHGTRTVLFLDEIHRFNKAQQDALLPHVEDGTITLVGATTENPYFEVNAALLSRMRVWRLEAADRRRGRDRRPPRARRCGARSGRLARTGRRRRARRRRLRAPGRRSPAATRGPRSTSSRVRPPWPPTRASATPTATSTPRLEDIETAAQQRVLAYDRAGDGHYDTVSAFIKSLRGNDPDAALYWLAAMVAAGEDPRFIARRLIISASEDVGNADPRALQVAVAASAGARLDRAAGGAVRAGPGDRPTSPTAPKCDSRRARLLGGRGRRRWRAGRCRSRTICATPAIAG